MRTIRHPSPLPPRKQVVTVGSPLPPDPASFSAGSPLPPDPAVPTAGGQYRSNDPAKKPTSPR